MQYWELTAEGFSLGGSCRDVMLPSAVLRLEKAGVRFAHEVDEPPRRDYYALVLVLAVGRQVLRSPIRIHKNRTTENRNRE